MKKTISAVLSAAMLASCIVLPATAANKNTETITYRYDNGNWVHTREMEKLGRGLVAIQTSEGVYLSWRLLDSEDAIFGSAEENVSFDIYKNGTRIHTESETTNYLDAYGTDSDTYFVTISGVPLSNKVNSITEGNINVSVSTAPAKIYAVKYSGSTPEKVAVFETDKPGIYDYSTTGFTADKVYIWDDNMKPIENDETATEAVSVQENNYFDIDLSDYIPEPQYLPRVISLLASDDKGYNFIASKDAPETIPSGTYAANVTYYVSDFKNGNTAYQYYPYTINDCSVGDVDGDGEYELIVKWDCNGQDNSQGGVTGDVLIDAYKMDGTQLWRINLGKNIRAGAHYTQFLVYDFDGDGKAEMTCKTAPGSKDSRGAYVTTASHINEISNISNTINETDYRGGSGFIITGDEYLTVFNGATGEAIDTIYYPNQRIDPYLWGDRLQDGGGNRVDRFTAAVAYIDGVKPYAVYMRGYYMHQNGGNSERQAACAVSFDGTKLDCKYSFDTYDADSYKTDTSQGSRTSHTTTMNLYSSYRSDGSYKGVNGYVSGNEAFVGEGNHNCSVADVDGDGKDEVMTGALCYELKDNGTLGVKWCTFLEHGDALHIGDYDPTHEGFEFFNVQEDSGPNTKGGSSVPIGYGMTMVDPGIDSINTTDSVYDDLIMFRESAGSDTGRGVMANIGMGGYYQFWSSKNANLYMSNGDRNYTSGSKSGLAQNFRIFWDGDLYDELLDGIGNEAAPDNEVRITSWNKNSNKIEEIFMTEGCATANSTKKTPALTADIFGDWREELIVRLADNSGLRVYSTTTPTDYKIKTLMQDPVYRSGVAAEQTAYNQPPHVGMYLNEEIFGSPITDIAILAEPNKKIYAKGDKLDISGLRVAATHKDGSTDSDFKSFSISKLDTSTSGEKTITVSYGENTAQFTVAVLDVSSISVTPPTRTKYATGQDLNTNGMVVTANYENGISGGIDLSDCEITGYNKNTNGTQTVTVSYGKFTDTFKVTVQDADISLLNDTYVTASTDGALTEVPIGSYSGNFTISHKMTINSMPADGTTSSPETSGFFLRFTPKSGTGAGWYLTANETDANAIWKAANTKTIAKNLSLNTEYTFVYAFKNVGSNNGVSVDLTIYKPDDTVFASSTGLSLRNMGTNKQPLTKIDIYNHAKSSQEASVTISDATLTRN